MKYTAMEPIKIGWLGSALDGPGGGYDKIHRLAFDEAAEAGLLDRPVEFVLHGEHGLPNGSAKNATDGFRYLVDEGCIAVAGAYSSDNAITVGPLANELQVPQSMSGSPCSCAVGICGTTSERCRARSAIGFALWPWISGSAVGSGSHW